MELLEGLKKARAVLTEIGWAQGYYAYDARGTACEGFDRDACKFCAVGALQRAVGPGELLMLAHDALEESIPLPGYCSVAQYNDDPSTTLVDVLALYDRAIVKLEAAQ